MAKYLSSWCFHFSTVPEDPKPALLLTLTINKAWSIITYKIKQREDYKDWSLSVNPFNSRPLKSDVPSTLTEV